MVAIDMCGRFVSKIDAALERAWKLNAPPPDFTSYNVAPGTDIPAVRLDRAGEREPLLMRWGLIPFWAKELRIGYKMINARAETVTTKPAFKHAYQRRRCLIPAAGFYEWQKAPSGKVPHYIHRRDGETMAFAGLWERWRNPETDGTVESCTIVTTAANDVLAPLHDRMPVILERGDFGLWLEPGAGDARPLLRPCPDEWLDAYPVSTYVNKPEHDDPRCIERLVL